MIGSVALCLAAAVATVDSRGYPVYGSEPLPAYADDALTAARRADLATNLPVRLASANLSLSEKAGRVAATFAGSPAAFQAERVGKRLQMAGRLGRLIDFQLKKGTVSALCQAEAGLANLEAFLDYFDAEIRAWQTYPDAPHVRPTVFSLADFGACGDGKADDEPAFQRALARIRELGGRPSVLRIPAGEYLLRAKPVGGKRAIVFARVENCLVAGEDPARVKLVYGDYDGDGIDFRGWENSTLRNVQVYWRETPFVEGEIVSVDAADGSLVLRHHAGTLRPDDPRLRRIGHSNSCMQFDRSGHPIRKPVLWFDYRTEDLGDGLFRLRFDPKMGSTKTMPADPGAVFVIPDRNNGIEALRATGSRLFNFEGVWVRNSRCGAFVPGASYCPTVVRCRIFPKDSRFMLSTNADGNFTSIGTAILHCEFDHMNDDGSNAHGRGQLLLSGDAPSGSVEHDAGGWSGKPGDFVQVVSTLDGRFLANARIRESVPTGVPRRQRTVLDAPLPATVKTYRSLGIEPYDYETNRKIRLGSLKTAVYPDQFYVPFAGGVGYVCVGNRFADIRGVAVQVQSSCALVESNRVEHVYRGVELSGLLHYQEGPPPSCVTIRGNEIRHVNRGIKSCFMTLNHPPAVTTPMAGLVIEDNVVEDAVEKALVLMNAEDSLVRGNRLTRCARSEMRVCRDVRLVGNKVDGRDFGAGDFDAHVCYNCRLESFENQTDRRSGERNGR